MEAGGVEGQSGAMNGDGGQKEKIYDRQMGDKWFGDEGGAREQR